MTTVFFSDSLKIAASSLRNKILPAENSPRIIRDVYGRLRFALNCERKDYPEQAASFLLEVQKSIGVYASGGGILFRDSFSNPDVVFGSSDWNETVVGGIPDEDGNASEDVLVKILDRQITGKDWLRPSSGEKKHPHRIVFFGLKGGVGRSTALCMVAWGLASRGKRVLLVDFDLESPGLSGLLLKPERMADFGIVDWLVEDAVGQGDEILNLMVSDSQLGHSTPGSIRVAAAMGRAEDDYLSKLARAYADVPSPDGPLAIGARMLHLVEKLEEKERPEVVLIDSRAGLHDLAAVSIAILADTALLFATDGAQTWKGYEQLFSYWRRRPYVAQRVRERLAIVRALTPKINREQGVRIFKEQAYSLFSQLYDEIPVEASSDEREYFNPGEEDESAPHAPILIDWDKPFQEFDPALRPENGGATEEQIRAAFGVLIDWCAQQALGEVDGEHN